MRNSKVVKSSGINYSVWEVICFVDKDEYEYENELC
jgi:hypothetical protein